MPLASVASGPGCNVDHAIVSCLTSEIAVARRGHLARHRTIVTTICALRLSSFHTVAPSTPHTFQYSKPELALGPATKSEGAPTDGANLDVDSCTRRLDFGSSLPSEAQVTLRVIRTRWSQNSRRLSSALLRACSCAVRPKKAQKALELRAMAWSDKVESQRPLRSTIRKQYQLRPRAPGRRVQAENRYKVCMP